MSETKENYSEVSKYRTLGVAILLSIIISIVESVILIRIIPIDEIFKLIAIQVSFICINLASKVRRNKHIYLITPFTYEEAKAMTAESRSRIALEIYKIIAIPMAIIFIYSMISIVIYTSIILDVSVIISILLIEEIA